MDLDGLVPVGKRDQPVTDDNKKMSLFENFGTVKRLYTIIISELELQTWLTSFSQYMCVPASIKPNISLPLNHIKTPSFNQVGKIFEFPALQSDHAVRLPRATVANSNFPFFFEFPLVIDVSVNPDMWVVLEQKVTQTRQNFWNGLCCSAAHSPPCFRS